MLRIEGLDHVAFTVRNVGRSVAWYQETLGFERRFEDVWGEFPAVVVAADGKTGLALFPPRTDGPDAPADRRKAPVAQHVAFAVNRQNFEQAQAELKARGVEWTYQHHTVSESIYFEDPDGHKLELTTYEVD